MNSASILSTRDPAANGLESMQCIHLVSPYNCTVMDRGPASAIGWLVDEQQGAPERLIPCWLFLRALGAIYFSAFFSLVFQICGLIGPEGILPASHYLHAIEQSLGHWQRVWYAPTLLWLWSVPIM